MNMKKVLAGAVASVMAVSTMAIAASAEVSFPYTATIGFADASWACQDWETTLEITEDGTYTIATADFEDDEANEMFANGIKVFVIDIAKLGADLGITEDSENYGMAAAKFSDVKVKVTDKDGNEKDLTVDQSKLVWGDIEGKGNLRLELYNSYGPTTGDGEDADPSLAPVNRDDIVDIAKLSVTFTLTTASEPTCDDPGTDDPGTDDPQTPPNTGVEGVAVVAGLAIVAAGALVIVKKRK